MKLTIGLHTDPGPREGHNQDAIFGVATDDQSPMAMLIVSDGMGGAKGGELASQETVSVIRGYLLDEDKKLTRENAADTLREAIKQANIAVFRHSRSSSDLEGMGCTVVIALVIGDMYWIASVGDSRAYLVREGKSRQLTDDHTWVNARVREGLLTPEQAANHSLRHVLDRALGTEPTIESDVWPEDVLEEGDMLILCTDGLYGVLKDTMITEIVDGKSAQDAAKLLVESAINAKTHDNTSAVVLRAD